MRNLFKNFRKSKSGATLVEYGVALIVAIVLGGGALSLLADDIGIQMGNGCGAMVPTVIPSNNYTALSC